MQGVRVQVSARQRLLTPETRNLKPVPLKHTPTLVSLREEGGKRLYGRE